MAEARALAQATDAVAHDDQRSRAYARAQRHSRRVRFFKFTIPIGAALAIGSVLILAFFDPFGRIDGLSVGPVRISGTKLTMEAPRLTGFRKDNRGYEVTATTAMQDVRKPTIIELTDMRARLVMDDSGGLAVVESDTGVFDTQKEFLELKQNVRVRTDAGQQAFLASAVVDFKAGTVSSREPVAVKFTGGSVDADALDVLDHGKVLSFKGRVHTLMEAAPEAKAPRKAPEARTPSPVAENTPPAGAANPESARLRR